MLTDDWVVPLATMVQTVGVIVPALGLPPMFASLDHGDTPAIGVTVAGYVVMREALARVALELAGPFLAERRARTPWHPHHIAERYSVLVIGEVILGTVASLDHETLGHRDLAEALERA